MNAHFTPVASLVGGVLIGVSATTMLVLDGKIAGISGIVTGMSEPRRGDFGWRALFVLGLLVGGLIFLWLRPSAIGAASPSLVRIAIAGVLVGVGTQLSGGCTSGHGVCGLSRLSPRSMVATGTFMLAAGLTTYVVMHVLGGGA